MTTSWKDITAEQYLKITKSKDNKEILQIIFDTDLNKIPVKYFDGSGLEFLTDLPKPVDVTTYIREDKVYKLVPLDKISMGEYIDLTSLAENWEENVWKIMTILYRPVSGVNPKHRFKRWLGQKMIDGGKIFRNKKMITLGSSLFYNLDYVVEKYDPDKHFLNQPDFKEMSADQFYSFMLFFSLLSTKKTLGTPKSSSPTKKRAKKANPSKPS
jgi:hypothetical protein